MKKVKLDFMVVPEHLKTKAYVPDKVRIRIINPEEIFVMGLLGKSGIKLVDKVDWYFVGWLARKMIKNGIAIEVKE